MKDFISNNTLTKLIHVIDWAKQGDQNVVKHPVLRSHHYNTQGVLLPFDPPTGQSNLKGVLVVLVYRWKYKPFKVMNPKFHAIRSIFNVSIPCFLNCSEMDLKRK